MTRKSKKATAPPEESPPDVEQAVVDEHQDEPESDNDNGDADKDLTEEERRERDEIVPYLLRHAYHLPGNTVMQDWWQYQTNNHPVIGICLHHKYHPLSWKIRAISLFGSMLFGLALTSIVYCAFVFVDQDKDKALVQVQTNFTVGNAELDAALSQVSVTTGNLVLWFLGAPLHGLYDSFAWLLAGCTCIQFTHADSKAANMCRKSGAFLTTLVVILIMAITSFAVMLRASLESNNQTIEFDFSLLNETTTINGTNFTEAMNEYWQDVANTTTVVNGTTSNLTEVVDTLSNSGPNILESHILVQEQLQSLYTTQNFEDYLFVVSYFVELMLTYAIYYPIFGTLMFSGVLAKCFACYPSFLGGRPYEMRQLELAKQLKAEEDMMEKGEVEVQYNNPTKLNDKDDDDDEEEEQEAVGKKNAAKQSTKPKKPKSQSSVKTSASTKSKASTKTAATAKSKDTGAKKPSSSKAPKSTSNEDGEADKKRTSTTTAKKKKTKKAATKSNTEAKTID